jgi:hypothetical protein
MKNQNIQFKRTTPFLRIVGSLLCALLASFAALTARAQTATVIDPQGDAFYSNGNEAPAFLDILAASFTISDTLTLTVDVAGSLDALPNPPGSHVYSTGTSRLILTIRQTPPGLPLPPGQVASAEFYVGALWDGTAFIGLFIDRRPLLTGQPALLYSIPVSVSDRASHSRCPRRGLRRYGRCPARPGIASRCGLVPEWEPIASMAPT